MEKEEILKDEIKNFSNYLFLNNYELDNYEGIDCWYRKLKNKKDKDEIIDTDLLIQRYFLNKNQILNTKK